jgi:hypothetical protein
LKPIQANRFSRAVVLLGAVLLFNSCYFQDMHLREYLRPIRKIFNKDRSYWTDKIEYRGESGSEIVYYKKGRPALERQFDETGLLKGVSYFDRKGDLIRSDSLVYAGDELISAYYFAEPQHELILRFLNYSRQGQLSQRSWFGGKNELLSREFFLFDLQGHRRMRMIFDGNDSLLFSETFRGGSDERELQNIYTLDGRLSNQVRYPEGHDPVRYHFHGDGRITRIDQLRKDGSISWTNDLIYGQDGSILQSNFSTESRFLVSHMGDLEFFRSRTRTWKHPMQPGPKLNLIKYAHQDPWVEEMIRADDSTKILEYRFPASKAIFKKTILNPQGIRLSDTLFGGTPGRIPLAVMHYDKQGNIATETIFDLQGQERWLRKWYRDLDQRVIREEVIALPDSFSAAITRFYDCFGESAFSESFSDQGTFQGTWVNYVGGGIKKTLYYDTDTRLSESWLIRPAGDTTSHSRYQAIDYFVIQSRFGPGDTLGSQRRYTIDGLMDWELFFDRDGQILRETQRKKTGEIYKETRYDPETRTIESTTFAPSDPEAMISGRSSTSEISSHVVKKLNTSGKTIQLVSRNTSGDVEWETRYAYRGGKLLKSAQLDSKGVPVVISSYTHDEQGLVLTETAKDAEGNQIHFIEQKYNEQGQLIWKSYRSDLSGLVSSNRYYYDDLGRVSRNEIIEALHFVEAVDYEYFPEYHLRLASHFDNSGELMRKEIENYFGDNVFAPKNLTEKKDP